MRERMKVVELRFTIGIDGTGDRRYVQAQATEAEPLDVGWFAPLGEAFAVHGPGENGERIAICADDTRALMTLVKEFAQAVLDSDDEDDDDEPC